MSFIALYLLFPLVLAIHNAEEYARHGDFIHVHYSRLNEKFTTRRVIGNAVMLLTLTTVVLSALTYLYPSAALLSLARIAVFALMLNGIGHCLLSFKRHALTPGTLSAIFLVLPYSVVAALVMRTDLGDSFSSMLRYAAFGGIAAPLAAISFIWIGYGFSHLTARAP